MPMKLVHGFHLASGLSIIVVYQSHRIIITPDGCTLRAILHTSQNAFTTLFYCTVTSTGSGFTLFTTPINSANASVCRFVNH